MSGNLNLHLRSACFRERSAIVFLLCNRKLSERRQRENIDIKAAQCLLGAAPDEHFYNAGAPMGANDDQIETPHPK